MIHDPASRGYRRQIDGKGIRDIEDRSCTDVCSLCAFLLYWVGMVVIGFYAVRSGDLESLYLGTDHMGHRCGKGDMSTRREVYYPRLSQDLFEQSDILQRGSIFTIPALYGLCVAECPQGGTLDDYGYEIRGSGAMQATWHVPMHTFSTLNRCLPHITANRSVTRFCVDPPCSQAGERCVNGLAMLGLPSGAWHLEHHSQLVKCGREIDLEQTATTKLPNSNAAFDQLLAVTSQLEAAYESVLANRVGIGLFGICLPLGLGFAWMLFLFLCSGVAVSLVLSLLGLLLFLATAVFAYKGGVGDGLVGVLFNGTVSRLDDALSSFEATHVSMASAHHLLAAAVDFAAHSPLVVDALQVEEESMRAVFFWLSVTTGALFVVYTLLVCLASQQIARTTKIVAIATQVVQSAPGMVLFPLFVSAFQIALLGAATLTLALLLSDETETYQQHRLRVDHSSITAGLAELGANLEGLGYRIDLPPSLNASRIVDALPEVTLTARQLVLLQAGYVTFGAFWSFFFLNAIGIATVSGCVVYFYFMDKDTATSSGADSARFMRESRFADNQTDWPLLTNLCYTLRFSLGTMALGSLLLAIVESVRVLLEFVHRQTQQQQQTNLAVSCAMGCCRCCLWCFEKSIKFVSAYAYVYVVMENRSFCYSCAQTFSLISRHTTQLAINSAVQWMLAIIQTVSIPLGSTLVAYQSFISPDNVAHVVITRSDASTSPYLVALVPTSAVFVLSLLLARSFTVVYEQVVTALTVCVLHDIDVLERPVAHMRKDIREAFEIDEEYSKYDDEADGPRRLVKP